MTTQPDEILSRERREILENLQEALCKNVSHDGSFVRIRALHKPHSGVVGGDFFDTLLRPDGCEVVFIGDVTGHGSLTAPTMSMIYGAVRIAARFATIQCELVFELNELLYDLGARIDRIAQFSATLFVAFIHPDGTVGFAGAGQPPLLLIRGDGTIEELSSQMPPLGFQRMNACHNEEIKMSPGDALLFYTDGILDDEGFVSALKTSVSDFRGKGRDALLEKLIASGADDDRTAALVEYLGVAGKSRKES